MIAIINYGLGNVGSIQNMLKKAGSPSLISGSKDEIASASKLMLPGMGAFGSCMEKFGQSGLRSIIEKKVFEAGTHSMRLNPLLRLQRFRPAHPKHSARDRPADSCCDCARRASLRLCHAPESARCSEASCRCRRRSFDSRSSRPASALQAASIKTCSARGPSPRRT